MDFIEISKAPEVDMKRPIIIFNDNLLSLRKKYDNKETIISFELLNNCVNKDEFFSLLMKKL